VFVELPLPLSRVPSGVPVGTSLDENVGDIFTGDADEQS
jgi:hypothetical protein